MSTAEVEAALTEHSAVAEAAVVSRPHKVKGECLYCFVTLKNNREFNHTLVEELRRLGEALTRGISTHRAANFGFKCFLLSHFVAVWVNLGMIPSPNGICRYILNPKKLEVG